VTAARLVVLLLVLAALVAGCGGGSNTSGDSGAPAASVSTLGLTSTGFVNDARTPVALHVRRAELVAAAHVDAKPSKDTLVRAADGGPQRTQWTVRALDRL
jgi:hypothetical protein